MDHIVRARNAIGAKNDKCQGKSRDKNEKTNNESTENSEINTKSRREMNWSDDETSMLLELLCEVQCRKKNPYGDGGYNDHEWSYVYNEFTKKNIQKRTLPSLKLRWKNLKCDFSFFRSMANRSGCGWNEEAHVPDVPKDAWIYLKEKDPTKYKKYVKKTFPWYQQMEVLYGKNIASGRGNVTTDPNCSIPHTFDDGHSSSNDDNDTTQQELNEFSIPEFRETMMRNVEQNHEPMASRTHIDGQVHVPTQVDNETIYFSVDNLDESIHAPISSVHELPNEPIIRTTGVSIPANCTQNRKRGSTPHEEPSRHTKSKKGNSRMEEFAERFLHQQQERTRMIAQLGQANHSIQDQVLEKLKSLALPIEVHIDMEMSLGNSWIRGCFLKEDDKERLMLFVEKTIALFRSGKLSLNL